MTTEAPPQIDLGDSPLFRAERRQAGELGYRVFWKFQQEINALLGACWVAVVVLKPATKRARSALRTVEAGEIMAEQRFPEIDMAPMALGDALRAALELAEGVA